MNSVLGGKIHQRNMPGGAVFTGGQYSLRHRFQSTIWMWIESIRRVEPDWWAFTLKAIWPQGGGVGQDHVNPDFADSALLLPLNLYGEKRRPFRWANKTCRALL